MNVKINYWCGVKSLEGFQAFGAFFLCFKKYLGATIKCFKIGFWQKTSVNPIIFLL